MVRVDQAISRHSQHASLIVVYLQMVRLTVDTIDDSYQFVNAVKQREICLRNLQIPVIENLGITRVSILILRSGSLSCVLQDQFDVIDLTDNNIRKVENLPLLSRLDTLLLHNNRVQ